ncbi:MAG TPA: T9SS type A sorting domain-containing protein, partial [Sunxiuqinia sp.]|nr:T9SS type A sorting domain-containing protein [Sunxiuqinia sp.]
ESFGNDIGTGWTYPHIFKIKGTYDYRCDLHYSLGMVGKIIVNSTATGFAANKVRGEDVLLYPNPATAKVHVWVKGMNAAPTTIAFYNALGSKIQIQPYSTNSDQIDFDIQNFKQGLYLLKVKNQQVEKVIKFVKQ